jgi:hypothetical protein
MEPNYEGLSIWERLRILSEWSPLVGYAQRFMAQSDPHLRSIIVAEACEWMALKTRTTADEELVRLVMAILRSPEGEALVRWGVAKVEEVQ